MGSRKMEDGDDRRAGHIDKVAVSETGGNDEGVKNLLLMLKPQDLGGNDDDLRVISIVNSEAAGKTALARSVYGKLDVKRWFAYRAWVRLQDNFAVEDVLVNILRQISTDELKDVDRANKIELSEKLRVFFLEQRYLIVLDNVSNVRFTAELLSYLLDLSNGSRVIITTRNVDLPNRIDIDPIKFDPLTEGVKKELLSTCSYEIEPDRQDCPAGLHVVQRILSRCNPSPAGIRLLGRLLSMRQDSDQFEELIGGLAEKENPSVLDKHIVSLCYDDLNDSLKNCIMYVSQFPREYEIPTRRLLRLWLANNLLPAPHRGIEDAEDCFQELVHRNMIHVVTRCKGRDFAKTCHMPGFIHDFLHQKALEMGFFEIYSHDSSTNTPKVESKYVALQRIVVDIPSINDRLGGSSETQEQSDKRQYNEIKLRSFISFNTVKIKRPKRELDIVLNPEGKKSSLEVLDLEGVYKPVLPKNLGLVLLNLKYLGLRWTILHELPESVGDLPCLETLDVKHTNVKKIPRGIWIKKSLRHLYLNELNLGKSLPHRGRLSPSSKPTQVNNLQTLCGLRFEANSPMLDVLSKLTGIRKLSLTCPSTVAKDVIKSIVGLARLQSLRLKSKDLLGLPSKLYLENMNGFPSLSSLYLFGDLAGNDLSSLPEKLKSLTLSMSFLTINIMDDLGKLKFLTDLRLYAFSFDGETLTCAEETFPQLRVLKLWKLANLKSLTVMDEAMPCLEELDIRECQELREVQFLGYRNELKEVSLAGVKGELAKRLEESLRPSIIITTKLIASSTAIEG